MEECINKYKKREEPELKPSDKYNPYHVFKDKLTYRKF